LIVAFVFKRQIADVKFIGAHAEYDASTSAPIRTDADHAAALEETERWWRAKTGSRYGDKLEVLITLVETYEISRWPIEPADPVET
jgi:HTH-type transcriptional regulator/antitoxin HigA